MVQIGLMVEWSWGIRMCGILAELREQARAAGNDPGRVERALALVAGVGLRAAGLRYGTTLTACQCPDRLFRRARACKHMLALKMAARLARRFTIEGER